MLGTDGDRVYEERYPVSAVVSNVYICSVCPYTRRTESTRLNRVSENRSSVWSLDPSCGG